MLKGDAKPYVLATPRRIPLPLKSSVEQELKRMQDLGVIRKVEEPTEWCAGMVVVLKANGKVRICVDLTKLNQNVCRERHILPSVEQTLAQLQGARMFTKLDANSGFWQRISIADYLYYPSREVLFQYTTFWHYISP